MIFDISEDNPPVWFDFPGGGRVQLKAGTIEDSVQLRKKVVTFVPFLVEGGEGKPPRVLNQEIIDEDKMARLSLDAAIVDWEGFEDAQGNPIPCTAENKVTLMRMKNPVFRDFVNAKFRELEEAAETARGDRLKN